MSKSLYGQIDQQDSSTSVCEQIKEKKRVAVIVLSALLLLSIVVLHTRTVEEEIDMSYTRINPRPRVRAPCASVKSRAGKCKTETKYISSELEQLWLDNANEWGADYCNSINTPEQLKAVQTWLSTLAELHTSSSNSSSKPLQPNEKVFSRFVTITTCDGQQPQEHVTWIEPLSHGLRHPQALCGFTEQQYLEAFNMLMNTTYLWLADGHQTEHQRQASSQNCVNRTCQNIYIDLGATTWSNHEYGAAGQQWFVSSYARRGIEFDRLLLWEAKPVTPPSKVYEQLPPELMHRYQYFNIPATSDLSQPAHPMNILKQIAQPGDFVVFKLDIDNAPVETSILQAIIDDPDAFALVDEFFFEYHVNFQPMLSAWQHQHDPSKTLTHAYKTFQELRQCGWRAHSWV